MPRGEVAMPSLVGLVGCVKSKQPGAAAAKDLYISPLFRGRRAFVERTCDIWFVLSAKHGLVEPDAKLEPYEATLERVSSGERRRWSAEVLTALVHELGSLVGVRFQVHAGTAYRNHGLIDGLRALGALVEVPGAGLAQGRLLAFYKCSIASRCSTTASARTPEAIPVRPLVAALPRSRAETVAGLLLEFGATLPANNLFPTIVAEAAEFATTDPFAFLIAACLDRGRPAEIIWTIPHDLRAALGHLDAARLARATAEALGDVLRALPRKPRYVNDAPRTIGQLATIVASEFDGDAAGVWRGRSAGEVRETLLRIHGVGPGIASMTVLLIERAFGVRFADLDRPTMDIKADVHTMRVLHRLGVAPAEGEREAVEAARRLHPGFPGALDAPLWVIGRRWCQATAPRCGECPIRSVCERRGL